MTQVDQLVQEATPTEPAPPRRRPVVWVTVVVVLAFAALAVNAVAALTGGGLNDSQTTDDQVATSGPPVAVLDVELSGMDVARGVQQVLVLPVPQTASGLFAAETRLVVDREGLPPAIFVFAPDTTIFPAQFEVSAVGGRNDYPWDRYRTQFALSLDGGVGTSTLPVQAEVDNALLGWGINTVLTNAGTDTVTLSATTSRSPGTILVATTQFVAILAVGLMLAAVTMDNLQKRRPAFASVTAAFEALLLLTVIRTLMPNSPPVGIRLDFALTYPAILVATLAMLAFAALYLSHWIPARLHGEVPGGSMSLG
jgi:hypothetical protein